MVRVTFESCNDLPFRYVVDFLYCCEQKAVREKEYKSHELLKSMYEFKVPGPDGQQIAIRDLKDQWDLVRLLLPGQDKQRWFGLKEEAMVRKVIRVKNIQPGSERHKALKNWRRGSAGQASGDLPAVLLSQVFHTDCPTWQEDELPQKDSHWTVGRINHMLDQLAGKYEETRKNKRGNAAPDLLVGEVRDRSPPEGDEADDEDEEEDTALVATQEGILHQMYSQLTSRMNYFIAKIILKDHRVNLAEQGFLKVYHRSAHQAFQSCMDAKKVVQELADPDAELQGDIRLGESAAQCMRGGRISSLNEAWEIMQGEGRSTQVLAARAGGAGPGAAAPAAAQVARYQEGLAEGRVASPREDRFVLEEKFDGIRMQGHRFLSPQYRKDVEAARAAGSDPPARTRDALNYRFFSRTGNTLGNAAPKGANSCNGIVFSTLLNYALKPDSGAVLEEMVLDGEFLLWNIRTNRPMDFYNIKRVTTYMAKFVGDAKTGETIPLKDWPAMPDLQELHGSPKIMDVELWYVVFDIIHLESQPNIRQKSLRERQKVLAGILNTTGARYIKDGMPWKGRIIRLGHDPGGQTEVLSRDAGAASVSRRFCWSQPRSKADLEAIYRGVVEGEGEGLMIKDLDSKYLFDGPHLHWRKLKPDYMLEEELEVVLLGVSYGSYQRGGTFSHFLFGVQREWESARRETNPVWKVHEVGAPGVEWHHATDAMGPGPVFYTFVKASNGLSDGDRSRIMNLLRDSGQLVECGTTKKGNKETPTNKPACVVLSPEMSIADFPDYWVKDPRYASIICEVRGQLRAIVSNSMATQFTIRFPTVKKIRGSGALGADLPDALQGDALGFDELGLDKVLSFEEVQEKGTSCPVGDEDPSVIDQKKKRKGLITRKDQKRRTARISRGLGSMGLVRRYHVPLDRGAEGAAGEARCKFLELYMGRPLVLSLVAWPQDLEDRRNEIVKMARELGATVLLGESATTTHLLAPEEAVGTRALATKVKKDRDILLPDFITDCHVYMTARDFAPGQCLDLSPFPLPRHYLYMGRALVAGEGTRRDALGLPRFYHEEEEGGVLRKVKYVVAREDLQAALRWHYLREGKGMEQENMLRFVPPPLPMDRLDLWRGMLRLNPRNTRLYLWRPTRSRGTQLTGPTRGGPPRLRRDEPLSDLAATLGGFGQATQQLTLQGTLGTAGGGGTGRAPPPRQLGGRGRGAAGGARLALGGGGGKSSDEDDQGRDENPMRYAIDEDEGSSEEEKGERKEGEGGQGGEAPARSYRWQRPLKSQEDLYTPQIRQDKLPDPASGCSVNPHQFFKVRADRVGVREALAEGQEAAGVAGPAAPRPGAGLGPPGLDGLDRPPLPRLPLEGAVVSVLEIRRGVMILHPKPPPGAPPAPPPIPDEFILSCVPPARDALQKDETSLISLLGGVIRRTATALGALVVENIVNTTTHVLVLNLDLLVPDSAPPEGRLALGFTPPFHTTRLGSSILHQLTAATGPMARPQLASNTLAPATLRAPPPPRIEFIQLDAGTYNTQLQRGAGPYLAPPRGAADIGLGVPAQAQEADLDAEADLLVEALVGPLRDMPGSATASLGPMGRTLRSLGADRQPQGRDAESLLGPNTPEEDMPGGIDAERAAYYKSIKDAVYRAIDVSSVRRGRIEILGGLGTLLFQGPGPGAGDEDAPPPARILTPMDLLELTDRHCAAAQEAEALRGEFDRAQGVKASDIMDHETAARLEAEHLELRRRIESYTAAHRQQAEAPPPGQVLPVAVNPPASPGEPPTYTMPIPFGDFGFTYEKIMGLDVEKEPEVVEAPLEAPVKQFRRAKQEAERARKREEKARAKAEAGGEADDEGEGAKATKKKGPAAKKAKVVAAEDGAEAPELEALGRGRGRGAKGGRGAAAAAAAAAAPKRARKPAGRGRGKGTATAMANDTLDGFIVSDDEEDEGPGDSKAKPASRRGGSTQQAEPTATAGRGRGRGKAAGRGKGKGKGKERSATPESEPEAESPRKRTGFTDSEDEGEDGAPKRPAAGVRPMAPVQLPAKRARSESRGAATSDSDADGGAVVRMVDDGDAAVVADRPGAGAGPVESQDPFGLTLVASGAAAAPSLAPVQPVVDGRGGAGRVARESGGRRDARPRGGAAAAAAAATGAGKRRRGGPLTMGDEEGTDEEDGRAAAGALAAPTLPKGGAAEDGEGMDVDVAPAEPEARGLRRPRAAAGGARAAAEDRDPEPEGKGRGKGRGKGAGRGKGRGHVSSSGMEGDLEDEAPAAKRRAGAGGGRGGRGKAAASEAIPEVVEDEDFSHLEPGTAAYILNVEGRRLLQEAEQEKQERKRKLAERKRRKEALLQPRIVEDEEEEEEEREREEPAGGLRVPLATNWGVFGGDESSDDDGKQNGAGRGPAPRAAPAPRPAAAAPRAEPKAAAAAAAVAPAPARDNKQKKAGGKAAAAAVDASPPRPRPAARHGAAAAAAAAAAGVAPPRAEGQPDGDSQEGPASPWVLSGGPGSPAAVPWMPAPRAARPLDSLQDSLGTGVHLGQQQGQARLPTQGDRVPTQDTVDQAGPSAPGHRSHAAAAAGPSQQGVSQQAAGAARANGPPLPKSGFFKKKDSVPGGPPPAAAGGQRAMNPPPVPAAPRSLAYLPVFGSSLPHGRSGIDPPSLPSQPQHSREETPRAGPSVGRAASYAVPNTGPSLPRSGIFSQGKPGGVAAGPTPAQLHVAGTPAGAGTASTPRALSTGVVSLGSGRARSTGDPHLRVTGTASAGVGGNLPATQDDGGEEGQGMEHAGLPGPVPSLERSVPRAALNGAGGSGVPSSAAAAAPAAAAPAPASGTGPPSAAPVAPPPAVPKSVRRWFEVD